MFRECSPPTTCHMSGVRCHVSCVMCHVSRVMCNLFLSFFLSFLDKVVGLVGGWFVINRAYGVVPRLVSSPSPPQVPLPHPALSPSHFLSSLSSLHHAPFLPQLAMTLLLMVYLALFQSLLQTCGLVHKCGRGDITEGASEKVVT